MATSVEDKVASLDRDMAVVSAVVERLDVAIDRLADISSNVSNLLTSQTVKMEHQEAVAAQLIKDQEKLEDRLSKMERWKYYVVGIATAAGFAINFLLNYSKAIIGH